MEMKDFITEENNKQYEYLTFARQFDSYRWWKPFFTIFLCVFFYLFFAALVLAATMAGDFMWTGGDLNAFMERLQGGYDNMVITDVTGIVLNLGLVAVAIPALILARAIVHDRSFSSYSSSRGGWHHSVFIKMLFIALIVCALPLLGYTWYFTDHGQIAADYSRIALGLLIVITPLQCLAEEYIFRGLVNQTLGAWFRIPAIAIIISAVGFTALHPYNRNGQISILAFAIAMGVVSWASRGLEASSALHIVNNMACFLLDFFGISKVGSEVSAEEMILDLAINIVFVAVILLIRYRTDWFDRIKYHDAVEWNEDRAAKKARKAAVKQMKRERREAKRNS